MNKKIDLEKELKENLKIKDNLWKECLQEQENSGDLLSRIMISKGLASEDDLLFLFSRLLKIPYIRIKELDIDIECIKKIPAKLVKHYNFFPLKQVNGKLKVAISDPSDIVLLDEIRLFLGENIEFVIASSKNILESIQEFYGLGAETLEKMVTDASIDLEILKTKSDEDIKDATLDPTVIKFLNEVLVEAIKKRATDIHLEPFEEELRIRYRIDGVLYEVPCPASIKHFQSSIASRIKVMASLDITEKRRPQDGRIKVRMGNEVFDLRVSVLPTPFGESIGIRILSRGTPLIGLEQLGMPVETLNIIEEAIVRPYGIILATGPTGSGKTTTLYSCLSKINSAQRKIITVEDPIEYQLKGITQMQVEPKIGFTFATALRSMLRHDPNVMMVGEIRDTETAELAVRTSLTGHLVFSTLHTNDAAGAIARLSDMGVDTFLVSSSINLIIAQRLVRLICPDCKDEVSPQQEFLQKFDANDKLNIQFYHGSGCEKCRFTGYQGRSGIFEVLVVNDDIKAMILNNVAPNKLKQKAISLGMKTLRDAGLEKVKKGLTTLEEVVRVTQEEEG
ncbi:MAG: ATPase, T2SS/T4P/T4SS family [Candidatus Omnitrophota bacterium]|jgi:type II secretion system protein E